MEDLRLSAVVLTRNEAAVIERCLRALQWADEIVVVDSGSTDRTVEICSAIPEVRVVQQPFAGFAAQRNAGIDAARGEWILMVDADEVVPPALAAEIAAVVRRPGGPDGYWIPRLNLCFGRPLRHGGHYPDLPGRLCRRSRGRYTGSVHETLEVAGSMGRLANHLVHHSFATIGDYLPKLDRYTTLEAEQLAAQGVRVGWGRVFLAPPALFVRTWMLRRGFHDGFAGYRMSALGAFYLFVRLLKTRERVRQTKRPGPSPDRGAPRTSREPGAGHGRNALT